MIIGPFQFDAPVWLLGIPALWAVAWLIARRSLTGLGGVTRRVALAARFAVIALVLCALAEPRWRTIARDVAVDFVVDVSKSIPPQSVEGVKEYVVRAAEGARADDRLGVLTAAEEAFVQALPTRFSRTVLINSTGGQEGTDLASGVRLAMAVSPEDAARRIVLATDGNETAGSLLAAAQAAKAAGTPIDVLPIEYDIENEIILERLIAPQMARRGEPVNVRFVIRATRPTRARIALFDNDLPIDLDPGAPGDAVVVDLDAGVNVTTVPITLTSTRAQMFRATVEPVDQAADSIPENNVASAVTFVSGEGRVLMYAADQLAATPLLDALRKANIDVERRPPAEAHVSLTDLSGYDAVIMDNVSAYDLSRAQQDELRAYVHDLGGGLVVIGGPDSYGAGGWIGSPLADALPVKLDPPQKKHMPKGALALVMHSCEIPNGNYWGAQTAIAAVDSLSRLDLVGVIEYSWQGGPTWTFPLAEAGDKSAVKQAINRLTFGDMPDFESILKAALIALQSANAGQKHVIVISDGDPAGPSQQLVSQFIIARVSISTVAVMPHGGRGTADLTKMEWVAKATGGNYYEILGAGQLQTLPQIFIKEAQTVKRSLIWEGDPFPPKIADTLAEPLRGIRGLPPIKGYIVTAEREGLAQVTLKSNDDDPIMAQWQYGLGRVVAYTSDAATRWSPAWVDWPQFGAFWEQHVRWAMRPSGNAHVGITTETRGDDTVVLVEATDEKNEPLNFARFQGRVVGPDLKGGSFELRQTGAGRYEGRFESKAAGSYVMNLTYDAAKLGPDGQVVGVDRGAVQAAVTRPFADERRALHDNAALLRQVAELTGGRVLSLSDPRPDLFAREGLKMPVATRPIWLVVACMAIALFLVDVGVRRVRIDFRAMGRAVRRAFSRQKAASEAQVDAMRTAREKARGLIKKRSAEEPAPPGSRGPVAPAPEAKSTAGVKFEASTERTNRPAGSPIDTIGPRPGAPGGEKPKEKKAPAGEEEQGMSRLMKAKRRARESMQDDEDKNKDQDKDKPKQ